MCRLTFKPIYHGRLSSKADRGAIGKGEVGSLNELDLRPSGCHLSKDPVWSYKWKAERALKHWTKHPAETETARGRPPPLQDGDCANSRAISQSSICCEGHRFLEMPLKWEKSFEILGNVQCQGILLDISLILLAKYKADVYFYFTATIFLF